MGIQQVDRDSLKAALKDLIREEPQFFVETFREVINEVESQHESPSARKERMRAMIQLDFDEFEETFKALA